jgi:hypothetical protein
MKNIYVPETVEDYQADIRERAVPADLITENDFYRRLIGWTLDNRTPLLYDQDHADEYTNFSINFNWLLLRDYAATKLGPPAVIATMYAAHEFTHMTHRLNTRLDTMSAEEYAQDFKESEYRGSNETEILIHYRIPELRDLVLQGTKIAYDVMHEKGMAQPSAQWLAAVRPLVVEHDTFKDFFSDSPENMAVYKRFKEFGGNRQWALDRFAVIQPHFSGEGAVYTSGLTDDEYEDVISGYEPHLDQDTYEAHVIRNMRFGFAMCGLIVPKIVTFADARAAAVDLEGEHAIVQS